MLLDIKEILRYLNYRSETVDPQTNELILECKKEVEENYSSRYSYKLFDLHKSADSINLIGSTLHLIGSDIARHLMDSQQCYLLAVTLNPYFETRIKHYEKFDLSKSLIFDACCSVAIEQACDEVEEMLALEAKIDFSLGITPRFSPGYGDLPITIQPDILKILGAYKFGLTCTESFILVPRKSVTAILGIQAQHLPKKFHDCANCNLKTTCTFKKDIL